MLGVFTKVSSFWLDPKSNILFLHCLSSGISPQLSTFQRMLSTTSGPDLLNSKGICLDKIYLSPIGFHLKPNFSQILGPVVVLTPCSYYLGVALGLKGNTQAEFWDLFFKTPPSPTPCSSYSTCLRVPNTPSCLLCPAECHILLGAPLPSAAARKKP